MGRGDLHTNQKLKEKMFISYIINFTVLVIYSHVKQSKWIIFKSSEAEIYGIWTGDICEPHAT